MKTTSFFRVLDQIEAMKQYTDEKNVKTILIPYANSNMTLLVAHLWECLYKLVVNDYLM